MPRTAVLDLRRSQANRFHTKAAIMAQTSRQQAAHDASATANRMTTGD